MWWGCPFNVAHNLHVDFDAARGGFVGLPPEWEGMLKTSGITEQEQASNQEAVLNVLEFEARRQKLQQPAGAAAAAAAAPAGGAAAAPAGDQFSQPLPEESAALTLQELVSKEDPKTLFDEFTKIGEGAASEVFMARTSATGAWSP